MIMKKKEMIYHILEQMGYMPEIDEDDVIVRFQMKPLVFITNEADEDPFVCILYSQFCEFEEEESALYLAACNKLTREGKLVKFFVDYSLTHVSATCEFFFEDESNLEFCIEKALRVISILRTSLRECIRELSE